MEEQATTAEAGPLPEAEPAVDRLAEAATRNYDLSVEERLVRRPMPTLDIVNERFLRNLRQGLFTFARVSPEIAIDPVAVQRYSEFLGSLAMPVNFNIVALGPLRGSGIVACDATLISSLVDVLYGGGGKLHALITDRDFSPTEQRVIQRLAAMVCSEYNKAWKDIYALTMAVQRTETHAQFVTVAAPNEMVVVTSVRIAIGGFEGSVRLCIPYAVLEPIREVLYGAQQAQAMAEDRRWVSLLTREIQAAEVTLVADLAQAEVTVAQLLSMKAGDFIQFDRPARIVASIDGTPVFACHYGNHNARYALRIDECLRGDDPHWLGGNHVH